MDISLILCTYNRCDELAGALEGLAASTLPESIDWEVLVVDNNSSDETHGVVSGFARRYPGRFRYLFEGQQGKSYALNAGIRSTKSPILAFTDDDAVVEPDWLWKLTAALRSGEWLGAGGRIIPVWPKALPGWISQDDPQTMGPYVDFNPRNEAGPLTRPPYGANMAFRREAFTKYGDFRVDLGPRPGSEIRREDIEFANRLLAAGEPLRYEPEAIVRHPVPDSRLKKQFVLRWWYWYGRSEAAESGLPSGRTLQIGGVPLYLFRRMLRWVLQWAISIEAPGRFASRRNVWYIAGTMSGCRDWERRQLSR